jgi:hypothetical protein
MQRRQGNLHCQWHLNCHCSGAKPTARYSTTESYHIHCHCQHDKQMRIHNSPCPIKAVFLFFRATNNTTPSPPWLLSCSTYIERRRRPSRRHGGSVSTFPFPLAYKASNFLRSGDPISSSLRLLSCEPSSRPFRSFLSLPNFKFLVQLASRWHEHRTRV